MKPFLKIPAKSFLLLVAVATAGIALTELTVFFQKIAVKHYEEQIRKSQQQIQTLDADKPIRRKKQRNLYYEKKKAQAQEKQLSQLRLRLAGRQELDMILEAKTIFDAHTKYPIIGVSPGASQNLGDFLRRDYQIRIKGSYADILRYLAVLEKVSPYVRFAKITFMKTKPGEPLQAMIELQAVVLDKKGFFGRREALWAKAAVSEDENPFLLVRQFPRDSEARRLGIDALVFEGESRYALVNGELVAEGSRILEQVFIKSITERELFLTRNNQDISFKI